MSEVKVCRICLRTAVKMYHYNWYQLKFYYEEVMVSKVSKNDGLPRYFCYECSTILHKFHNFKEKCFGGHKVLKELLWKGPITIESIYKVDRDKAMLTSPINIITVSNRVKTYITEDSRETIERDKEDNSIENIQIKKIEYSSDASMEYEENKDSNDDVKPDITEIIEVDEIIKIGKGMVNDSKEQRTSGEQTIDSQVNIAVEDDINEMTSDVEGMITNLSNEKIVSNDEQSPKALYINVDNGNIKDKKNPKKRKKIKEKKKRKPKKDGFYPGLKVRSLDEKNWKKSELSEVDALAEFKTRAQGKTYLKSAFKCTDCFKGFSKEDMLVRHGLMKHAESIGCFECRFCRARFRINSGLQKHLREHYVKYECLRCPLVCHAPFNALLHDDYHNGVKTKCTYCDQEFKHMSTYYTHLRTHRSEHVCTLCGASFVSALGLKQHKNIKHIAMEISPEEEVNAHCERCDIKFVTREAYEEHVSHSSKHTEELNEELEEPNEVLAETKKKGLIRRRKDGRGCSKIPTTCSVCNKNFPAYSTYLKHHAAEHRDVPVPREYVRHICEICGALIAADRMRIHLNTHTRDTLFACGVCGMQFTTKSSMKIHELVHTGLKPYQCSQCDKRFTQKGSMKLHHRTYHLMEPYPKRNRNNKTTNTQETPMIFETMNVKRT